MCIYCEINFFSFRKTITSFEYSVLSQWFDYLVKSGRANVDLIGEFLYTLQIFGYRYTPSHFIIRRLAQNIKYIINIEINQSSSIQNKEEKSH